jgi:hypothetical protein
MPVLPSVTITNRTATSLTVSINNLFTDGVECTGSYINGVITKVSNGSVLATSLSVNGSGVLTANITTGSSFDETLDLTLDTNTEQFGCFSFQFQSTAYGVIDNTTRKFKTIFSKITKGLSYNPRQTQRRKFPTI